MQILSDLFFLDTINSYWILVDFKSAVFSASIFTHYPESSVDIRSKQIFFLESSEQFQSLYCTILSLVSLFP